MEQHEKVHQNKKEIMVNNFLGGIFWGLGATIGASVIIAVLGIVLSKVNLIPVVGTFVSQVTDFVLQNNPHLLK